MKKHIVIFLSLLIAASLIATKETAQGEHGWKMLTIPPNPSISAMGGTGANVSDEADAFMSHPTAGLIGANRAISVSQNNWHFGTYINSLAINLPQGNRSLGFALRSLDYGKFDARDITGQVVGEFHPLDVNIVANAAIRFSPNYYGGINLALLYQKIDTASSLGLATDIGLTYLPPLRGLKINGAVKHIGITSKVRDESIKLPVTPELSVGYNLPNNLEKIYTELKILKHPDDDDLKMVLGTNIKLLDSMAVSFGYRLNYDSHKISAGIGLKHRRIGFNYAYIPFEHQSSDAHAFSLTYRL